MTKNFNNFIMAINFNTLANTIANSPRMQRKYTKKTYHKVHREQRKLKKTLKFDPSNKKGGDRCWTDTKNKILVTFVVLKDKNVFKTLIKE